MCIVRRDEMPFYLFTAVLSLSLRKCAAIWDDVAKLLQNNLGEFL